MKLTLNYAACSDRGLVRGNNEDSAYAGPRLIALADGMGGHAAGEVASAFMIEALEPLDSPLIEDPDHHERLETLLATAMDEGNQNIAMHVDENPTLAGMGCTLSALLFRGSEVGLCHVGDSRGYRLRDGELEQITKDDTFVQSLVDQGKLDPEDVSSHPQRSLILKALTGRPVEPTLNTFEAQVGDRYMLCSDGLSDPVSRDTILEVLKSFPPAQAARKLVEMALRGGGPDNVTVVVADVVEYDDATGQPADSSLTLPQTAITVGAVAGDAADEQRPDSPASRAAALSGLKTTNSPAAASKKAEAQEATPARKSRAPKKSKRVWAILAVLLLMLLGVGAAGYMGYQKIQDTYYVAEDGEQIVINKGMSEPIAGIQISERYQEVCLTEKSKVLILGDQSPSDCHRFVTSDLTPAAQGALEALPEDNYDAVIQQVQRLAEQTLPVCVTRSPAQTDNKDDRDRADSARDSGGRAGESSSQRPDDRTDNRDNRDSNTDNARESETAAPQSSAPEDLTTPGVSCREVE